MPIVLSAPQRRFTYWREITAVLCLKVIGLAALYVFFFSPANQMTPTPQDVAHHLIDRAFSSEVGKVRMKKTRQNKDPNARAATAGR
jgi:hypothetical protein